MYAEHPNAYEKREFCLLEFNEIKHLVPDPRIRSDHPWNNHMSELLFWEQYEGHVDERNYDLRFEHVKQRSRAAERDKRSSSSSNRRSWN